MYLTNKLAGVRIGRMYVPAELEEYTAQIVNFVLASPGLKDDKAEFTIEKGVKTMFENENQIIEEITNSQAQTENEDEDESPFSGMPPHIKELMNTMAIRSLLIKSVELNERLNKLEQKFEALENTKCPCQSADVSEDIAS